MAFDFLDELIGPDIPVPTPRQIDLTTPKPTYVLPPPDLRNTQPYQPAQEVFRPTYDLGTRAAASLYRGPQNIMSSGAIFPERISTEQVGGMEKFFQEITQFGRGIETFVSPLKLIGDNAIGRAFAGAGESLPGQLAQQAVKFFVTEPLEAFGRLTIGGELFQAPKGRNIFEAEDPLAQLRENFELNKQTIGDVAEVIMAIPVFKAAKFLKLFETAPARFVSGAAKNMMTAEGSKALLKGDLAGWLTAPVRGPSAKILSKDAAEHWGAVAGRVTLGASAIGYAEAKVIEGLAPDSWAAKELARNQFVPEGNPMRVPLDLVESLPLDIFGLAGLGRTAVASANMSRRILGAQTTVLDDVFKRQMWKNAAQNIPGAMNALDWMNKKSMRDAAEWSLMHTFNASILATAQKLKITAAEAAEQVAPGAKLKPNKTGTVQFEHPRQLPHQSQEVYDKAVRAEVDRIIEKEGMAGMRRRQYDVIFGHGVPGDAGYIPAWEPFKGIKTDHARIATLVDYHSLAKDIDGALGDRLHAIVDESGVDKQVLKSWGFLNQLDDAEFNAVQRDMWANKFPAIYNQVQKVFDKSETIHNISRDTLMSRIQSLRLKTAETGSAERVGRILADLSLITEKILDGKATPELMKQRAASVAELNKLRQPAVDGFVQKIHSIEAAMAARRAELAQEAPGTYEQWAVNAEIDRLERLLFDENKRFFEVATAGTRYAIGHHPNDIVQKVFDAAIDGRTVDYGGRNRGGAIWDSLFASIPNKKLGLETYKRVEDGLGAWGNSPEKTRALYDALRKEVDKHRIKNVFGRSFSLSAFMNIYHLPTWIINETATELGLKVPKGTSVAELIWRSAPGPIKVFSEGVFGKSVDIPFYSPLYVNLTRMVYPLVRFTLSPRFIMMNLLEGDFFRVFLSGRNKLTPEQKERLIARAAQQLNARLDESGKWVYGHDDSGILQQVHHDIEYLVNVANGPRADVMTKAVLDAFRKSEAAQDYIKSLGIKSEKELVKHVEKTMAELDDAISGLAAVTTREKKLVGELTELNKRLASPLAMADEFLTRAEIAAKTREFDNLVASRRARMAAQQEGVVDPRMQPMVDAAAQSYAELIDQARQRLHGNPNRSAIERFGNSYMLYWPLSYQIKAGKALMSFLFDRGFGFKTNLAPAMMFADAQNQISQMREMDPEVEEFFQNNKQLIFIAKGFFPATPDEMGVSLGPALRLPMQTVRGYKTPASAFERATSIGLAYDADMGKSFITEQSKKGGILHDVMTKIFGEDENAE